MLFSLLLLAFLPLLSLGFDLSPMSGEDEDEATENNGMEPSGYSGHNADSEGWTRGLGADSTEDQGADFLSDLWVTPDPDMDGETDVEAEEAVNTAANELDPFGTIEAFNLDGLAFDRVTLTDSDDAITAIRANGDSVSPGMLMNADGIPLLHSLDTVHLIYGEDGDDEITTLNGASMLDGGDGNDTLVVQGGASILFGGSGNDTILGSEKYATFAVGGDGDDVLRGGDRADWLFGDNFNTANVGATGNDTIYGGGGNDIVFGGSGNDLLFGEKGNDQLYLFAGDVGNGGVGSDQFIADSEQDASLKAAVIEDFEPGVDRLVVVLDDATSSDVSDGDIVFSRGQDDTTVKIFGHEVAILKGCPDIALSDIEVRVSR